MSAAPTDSVVLFVELQGDGAAATLVRLGADLVSGAQVESAELLASVEQPGLYLLVCRCRRLPGFEAPPGARVWSFYPVAEDQAAGGWRHP